MLSKFIIPKIHNFNLRAWIRRVMPTFAVDECRTLATVYGTILKHSKSLEFNEIYRFLVAGVDACWAENPSPQTKHNNVRTFSETRNATSSWLEDVAYAKNESYGLPRWWNARVRRYYNTVAKFLSKLHQGRPEVYRAQSRDGQKPSIF